MPQITRYSRSYALCIEALQTLCCTAGDIRARLRLLDPEFLMLRDEDFPGTTDIRTNFIELQKLLTRFDPRGDEGRIAVTISRSKASTLEQAAQKVWELHRESSYYMNHNNSS